MSTPQDDDQLMALLAAAQQEVAEVSDTSRAAARAAFAWRTIDEDLMQLTFDSRLQDEVLVRGSVEGATVVGFQGADFSLEVERDTGELMGQVVPAAKCRVTLVTRAGDVLTVHADETGFFVLPLSADGPYRLRVQLGERVESTTWLDL
ncbi:hypothetical protein [Nocardioides sp.]|uniref:hypothetical protein n=1 Tax=Nocardioides sp. TaxID=35761 RepID=UPI002B27941D|nr:hypothetical protein [Nocardioides sp.]